MRIVHILTRLLRAGSEENILLTTQGQLAEGHEVILMYGKESDPTTASTVVPNAKQVEIGSLIRKISPVDDFAAYRNIREELRALRPDVVHTHQSKAGILGRFAAAATNVPVIIHGVHILPFVGETGLKKHLYLFAEKAAGRVTHGFIHVSRGMQQECERHRVGPAAHHAVVRSGFDLARFRAAGIPQEWRSILAIGPAADRPLVLGMLAALEPRKNHLELLDRLADFVSIHPNTRILFAGEGSQLDQIKAKIQTLGLAENVRMLGYRTDPENIIALCDICLLCSTREGLPRSVLQYLAAGKPALLFDLPGINEVIGNNKNGIVVPAWNWDKYLFELLRLADSTGFRQKIGIAAGQTDLDAWDWRPMGGKTIAVYQACLGENEGDQMSTERTT